MAAIEASDPVLFVGLTLAGLFEGAALGAAQATVLSRDAPAVNRRDWVLATSAAAGFAGFVGMGGAALTGSGIAPPGALLIVMVPASATALLSMGFAQWRVCAVRFRGRVGGSPSRRRRGCSGDDPSRRPVRRAQQTSPVTGGRAHWVF